MNAPKPSDGLRTGLQGAAPDRLEAVLSAIDAALAATKKAWVSCPHCNRRAQVEIPDSRAAVDAAKLLLEQAEGRPGTAETAQAQTVIVRRVVGVDVPAAPADGGETP